MFRAFVDKLFFQSLIEGSFEIFDPNSPSLSFSQRLGLLCKGFSSPTCFPLAFTSSFSHNKPQQFGVLPFFIFLFISLPLPSLNSSTGIKIT